MIVLGLSMFKLGSLRSYYGDGNENVTKQQDLIRKTKALHVRFKFCFTSPTSANKNVKWPNLRVCGGRERMTVNFSLSQLERCSHLFCYCIVQQQFTSWKFFFFSCPISPFKSLIIIADVLSFFLFYLFIYLFIYFFFVCLSISSTACKEVFLASCTWYRLRCVS